MDEIILKNPINENIRDSIASSHQHLLIAVPFISSYALSLFNDLNVFKIHDKRIITRFDETNINSFDLSTLKRLLDLGFEIRYDHYNKIHLKLYITDTDAYVTSSNLTKGGFEDNDELSVKIDSENKHKCIGIFTDIWNACSQHPIDHNLIADNWSKYEVLKKRSKFKGSRIIQIYRSCVGELNIDKIIEELFNKNAAFPNTDALTVRANIRREKIKTKLMAGYDPLIFYAPNSHIERRNNLFYDFVYGYENDLAGTGLREHQFRTAFEHPTFRDAVHYLFPEMIGLSPWNLNDSLVLQQFCNGIFDFKIPQYTQTLPIRLASFFFPEVFLPIFKLDHLQLICELLGLRTDAKTHGERLFAYTCFLSNYMKPWSYSNYIKSGILYKLIFTIELYNRLKAGEDYEAIVKSHKKQWTKNLIIEGRSVLLRLGINI